MSDRKNLVVWSGGMDSTLVLNNLAKKSTSDNPVLAVSFDVSMIHTLKLQQEKLARKEYLRYAKAKNYHIESSVIRISTTNLGIQSLGWPQQLAWFCFLLPYIPNECDVHYGYIQGDCCWLAVNEFYNMFKHFQYIGSRKETSLNFPLSFKTKREVLQEYKASGLLLRYSWTCEHPIQKGTDKVKPCGRCVPCVTLRMAKMELSYLKKHKAEEFRDSHCNE